MSRTNVSALLCFLASLASLSAQTITGVAERGQYTDQVSFQVQAEAGFTIAATLNGKGVTVGSSVLVKGADFYELIATRTPSGGGATTTNAVHFIILSSNRGDPERGLIEWTPYPLVSSTAAECAAAQLRVVTPQDYPQGLEIPVVARVTDSEGNERRVNGQVTAAGLENYPVPLLRGIGSGFLPAATASGTLNYPAQLQSLSDTKQINIEAATTWTTVSGTLGAATSWPAGSRIHVTGHLIIPVGGTLNVGEGTIVKLNPLVNITNNGQVLIQGTATRPVVFTATNHVQPEVPAFAWGGFILQGAGRSLQGQYAFFVGGGGATSWNFGNSESHKSAQPVLFIQNGAQVTLTNCFIINTAGQGANGYNSDFTYDHSLIQRAITSGEYVGGTITLNHSAVIEFPAFNGVVNAQIADADYDAIYFTTGTHILINSLFGFCKDDAIDSGSGGAGTVLVSNCWVEAALHECLAWSGGGRITHTFHTVAMNSGQGLECGWSTGNNSPLVSANDLLSLGNSVGFRYGDNYTSIGDNHQGFLTVSNTFSLYNYRDIFGWTWSDWRYRNESMNIHDNFITQSNIYHPNNTIWNPLLDGYRLAAFMTTPEDAPVGIGVAALNRQSAITQIAEGVPVRLSSFTTQPVSVNYTVQSETGATLQTGTLNFDPGETVKRVPVNVADPQNHQLIRVSLSNPVRGELTGSTRYYFVNTASNEPTQEVLLARNSNWKYNDLGQDLGTNWKETTFIDTTWASGPGDLGFGDGGEATMVNGGPSDARFPTIYFRTAFTVNNLASIGSLQIGLRRDDGGVIWINGQEVYRNNMPQGAISYGTFASGATPSETAYEMATVSPTALVQGVNLVAVEIHQSDAGSSDLHFDLELIGLPAAPMNTTLASRGAVWKYHNLGQDLGTDWRQPNFVDSGWSSGPADIGFGDPGIPTVITGGPSGGRFPTIYFRRAFTLNDSTGIGQLQMGLRRDDGGVVYLNGQEIFRSNMPNGPITYGTFAPGATSSETTFFQGTTNAATLVTGQNVLAIEIHQDDAGSSDLHFDFELIGLPGPSAPELNFAKFGSDLLLYWSDPAFHLEESSALGGPWSAHPGLSPVEIQMSQPRQFFRLRN